MGLFRREPTIGRSNLTQSDLDRLLDLDSDYRTDYTYVSSKSYRPDGSVRYENPRMFRLPIDSFRRKRAFEKAWESGYIQYFYLCITDFLTRFIANPVKVAGNIAASVVYFIVQVFWTVVNLTAPSMHSEPEEQHSDRRPISSHRHSFEREQRFSWSSDDDARLGEIVRRRSTPLHSPTFANESAIDSPLLSSEKTVVRKPPIVWRALLRILRLAIYIITMGFYPADFGGKKGQQRSSTHREATGRGGIFSIPHAYFGETPPFVGTGIRPGRSGDFATREYVQQTHSAIPPPAYDDIWETEGEESGMAPRVSTPFDAPQVRQQQRPARVPPVSRWPLSEGLFETVISEMLIFVLTVCALPIKAMRYAGEKTIDLFSPRSRDMYKLRSRSVRSPESESQPIPLFERTVAGLTRACTSTFRASLSVASSVLLAPVLATTYLVRAALGKTPAWDSSHEQTATPPSSKSDYMVGRAFGMAADFVYAFLTGFVSFFIVIFRIPVQVACCIGHKAMPFYTTLFTRSNARPQRDAYGMTTRSMSRGTVMPSERLPARSIERRKGYRRCFAWLIPLVGFLLLAGLVVKRCYEDDGAVERIELLQYPTVILGRSYEAASSASRSLWSKICALVNATGTVAHASKERIITAFASQPWTSKTKIQNKFESTRKSIMNSLRNGLSYIRLRLLDLWNYLWSTAEKASLLPDYITYAGRSVIIAVYEFILAIINALSQIAHCIWDNLLPLLLFIRSKLLSVTTIRWSEPIKHRETAIPSDGDRYALELSLDELRREKKHRETAIPSDGDRYALELSLDELRREKSIMGEQLEQLRRERELDEERYRELKKAIELTHVPSQKPIAKEDMIFNSAALNEELLAKKIEQHIHNYVTNVKMLDDSLINKRFAEMESRLLTRLEQLSLRIESDFDAKLGDAKRESGDSQNSLSSEISDLASAIANQRGEFDTFRRERDAKLAELAHAVMVMESGQAEGIKKIKTQINDLIKDEVAKGLNMKLTSVTEKSEKETEALHREIYKQIENRVMALFAAQVAKSAHEGRIHGREEFAKDMNGMNRFSESDLLVIRKLIVDALRVYDADKTGKVDYALESSGGSVISTRCTETYKEKSRLESIFGIPLWYSSYSPRSVIQHRANALSSGECWAFRGTGYLTIKLSLPIHITEVSYEHLRHELHPDGVVRSAPRRFQIWAFKELNDLETKVLLGEYEFDRDGDALQFFRVQHQPTEPTPIVELVVLSNWGADYTCLYRLRVHGERPGNFTMGVDDGSPLVDRTLQDEFVRGTRPANQQGA
ncbi:Nuclear migration and anchoring protein unc-84 [Toxocara canis]|uniref:Nuclear migration and anchoring protein unc-84 n=1 Tax=Toxocara canis TaxID=6265 RepID=A0A0B2V647_TOXCA|nr:Nuclear migration and anchoring protein unc-84 [Toxocara canis]